MLTACETLSDTIAEQTHADRVTDGGASNSLSEEPEPHMCASELGRKKFAVKAPAH